MIHNMTGGGSGKLYAAISVTYPEGSVCTCSDGVKTLTAKNTSGLYLFSIPYAGTWTVTATDGTDTASQTVEITTEGQSVSVELSYNLVLYSAANGLASGFNITGITIRPGIDMSKYSTCKVTGKKVSGSTCYFGFVKTSDLVNFVVESEFTSTSIATKTLNLQNISSRCYFSAGEIEMALENGYLAFGDADWEGHITSIILYP